MAARKRNPQQREADLGFISDLLLVGGKSHEQITEELNAERKYWLSRSMVSRDIALLVKRWQRAYLTDMNTLKVKELARIDRLEREYWDAWEKSKADKLSLERTQVDDTHRETAGRKDGKGGGKQSYSRTKTVTKKEMCDPNFMYLSGIQWCINKRCKIFGLDAPTTLDVSWRKQAVAAGVDPDAVLGHLEQQFVEDAMRNDKKPGLDLGE